jgi:hypothetical protein
VSAKPLEPSFVLAIRTLSGAASACRRAGEVRSFADHFVRSLSRAGARTRDGGEVLALVPRYLAEFEYRFNRRYDLAAMMPRLGYVAVRTPPMPYRLLKLAEDHA